MDYCISRVARHKQNSDIRPQNSRLVRQLAATVPRHNYIGQDQINPAVPLEHVDSGLGIWDSSDLIIEAAWDFIGADSVILNHQDNFTLLRPNRDAFSIRFVFSKSAKQAGFR